MAIQVRRGNEVDFDPSKMLPGEWAVSLDTRYVRMCFSPGICLRMATYEAFEADMAEIQSIVAEARTIQEAVARIQTEINNTAIVVEDYAILSKSYAVGGTGTREGEDVDNAKYYYEQAKYISQGGNGLVPLGSIAFENLPTEDIITNAMYNISNDFTSDERFIDGGGILYGKGSNVFYTADGKWDVLAASDVKGVKGEAEETFRQGNVTITAENIGLGNVNNTSDADKPISDATQNALDELIGKIDENEEDLQGQINVINSNLSEKVSWANSLHYGTEIFYGGGHLNIIGQQIVNDNGHYAGLILQETGWTKIDAIIPIMNASIPVVMTVQSNIIYAYSVNASGTYDNVPFSYVAIGR